MSLKEKIELDKTCSKYRSEIQNILTDSYLKVRNSNNGTNSLVDKISEEIIYTGTTYNTGKNISFNDSRNNNETIKTNYCPRVSNNDNNAGTTSFFDRLKSKLGLSKKTKKEDETASPVNDSPYYLLSQIRGGHMDLRNRIGKSRSSGQEEESSEDLRLSRWNAHSKPVKESNVFQNRIYPAFCNMSLQFSKILPYIILIILTIIALEYTRMKLVEYNNFNSINYSKKGAGEFDETYDESDSTINNQSPSHYYCSDIKDSQCSQTKILVKELIDYLRSRSGQVDCAAPGLIKNQANNNAASQQLPVDFIEKCVHVNTVGSYFSNERRLIKNPKLAQQEAMVSVLNAVLNNPHWKLKALNSVYQDAQNSSDITYLMSMVSSKPIMCRFRELVHFLYVRIIMVVALAIITACAYFGYKFVSKIRQENETEFFDLVKRATQTVEKQYELSILPESTVKAHLAINHVYDSLVEPAQRKSKKKLWNKVIKFIEDHESRIHLGTEFVDGEECLVWKWVVPKAPQHLIDAQDTSKKVAAASTDQGIGLANSTMIQPNTTTEQHKSTSEKINEKLKDLLAQDSTSSQVVNHNEDLKENHPQNNNGAWQGDAFNRTEKLIHSPTPCLKIRNMFDVDTIEQDPNFAQKIHNDILEKCCSTRNPHTNKRLIVNNSILHISCDRKSKEGCVYVKCSSNEAAGRVYQALNGTWYYSKLLNVKFLRSDRYLERFPESINFTKPLQSIQ